MIEDKNLLPIVYQNVLAIDPGGTTGMAISLFTGEIHTFTCSSPEQVFDFIYHSKHINQVIIENFNAQLIGKWGLHTVRIVGGVYALCHVLSIKHTVHMPQERYPFQKAAKEYLKGRRTVIHEKDALAHLFRWEFDNGIRRPETD